MTITNEAAERLREFLTDVQGDEPDDLLGDFDAALAEERRHVIEQITPIIAKHGWGHSMPMDHPDWRDGESAYDHIVRHLRDLSTPEQKR